MFSKPLNMMLLLVHGLLTSSLLLSAGVDACTSPTLFDGTHAGITTQSVQTLMATLNLPYLFLPMAETIIGAIVSNYETPIQVSTKEGEPGLGFVRMCLQSCERLLCVCRDLFVIRGPTPIPSICYLIVPFS